MASVLYTMSHTMLAIAVYLVHYRLLNTLSMHHLLYVCALYNLWTDDNQIRLLHSISNYMQPNLHSLHGNSSYYSTAASFHLY